MVLLRFSSSSETSQATRLRTGYCRQATLVFHIFSPRQLKFAIIAAYKQQGLIE